MKGFQHSACFSCFALKKQENTCLGWYLPGRLLFEMVRRKIKIERIKDAAARQITFSRRRGGLLKKAHDISILCDADVAVIIFSNKGKLFQFASSSMQNILDKYLKSREESMSPSMLLNGPYDDDADRLASYTQKLKLLERNLMGDDLERLSLRDLNRLEQQISQGLGRIRAKKEELLLDQLEELKEKVTEARTKTKVDSSFLFKPTEVTGPGHSYGLNSSTPPITEIHQNTDVRVQLPWLELCDQTNHSSVPFKRSVINDDLNLSPLSED